MPAHRHTPPVTYPPQPVHGPPGPPPQRNNKRTPLIVIGAVVGGILLLCLCGLVVSLARGDDDPGAAPTTPPATQTTEPATVPTAPPTPTEEPPPPGSGLSTAAPTSAAPRLVTMPKVVGENAAVADDKLRKLGFSNIQYGSQDENDTVVLLLANWTVTKQSTKAGAKIPTDTLIVITCTKH